MNTNNNNIRDIVIVGGGTAGWIAAAALSRVLDRQRFNVVLVESDQIGTVGVGEATIPPIRGFHRMLGIDEVDMLKHTNATFKLGIQFENWSHEGHTYFHPFGEYGRELDSIAFHQYWKRASGHADCGELAEYSLCTLAAKKNKFAPQSNDPDSVLSAMSYAYHFDATAYAKYLRSYAEKQGVIRVEGKVIDVNLESNSGFIQSVKLANGTSVAGDLFIDCTGFAGLLIGKTLQVEYEDWTAFLPADRAIAVQSEHTDVAIKPYTRSIANSAGWRWQIPLQNRVGNGLVYSSAFCEDDQAMSELISNLGGEPLTEPRSLSFTTGKRKQFWHKNCVAIGLASGFLEPLESTSIHLIQTAVTRLMRLFPGREFSEHDIAQYNREVDAEFEYVRDFIILHYHLNNRDEAMWRHCREMVIPESLQNRIKLFKNRGRVVEEDFDLFKTASWVAVMQGQGLNPIHYDPMAELKPVERLVELMQRMRQTLSAATEAMPEHAEFIAQNCSYQSLGGSQ